MNEIKFYETSEEALSHMEYAYEYECYECGSKFWGEKLCLNQVECPVCQTRGTELLSFIQFTGRKIKKGGEMEIDNKLKVDEIKELNKSLKVFGFGILI